MAFTISTNAHVATFIHLCFCICRIFFFIYRRQPIVHFQMHSTEVCLTFFHERLANFKTDKKNLSPPESEQKVFPTNLASAGMVLWYVWPYKQRVTRVLSTWLRLHAATQSTRCVMPGMSSFITRWVSPQALQSLRHRRGKSASAPGGKRHRVPRWWRSSHKEFRYKAALAWGVYTTTRWNEEELFNRGVLLDIEFLSWFLAAGLLCSLA